MTLVVGQSPLVTIGEHESEGEETGEYIRPGRLGTRRGVEHGPS